MPIRFVRALFACVLSVSFYGIARTADIPTATDLDRALDRQDIPALESMISQYQRAAQAAQSAEANYRIALADSYAAEIAMELRDKKRAETFAEAGIGPAKKAISEKPQNAEYHRILGELCGQVIPANPVFGSLKYGQCARDEINKAIQLDNTLALAYVSRGVGNYYLPSSMGGGIDLALKDFDKAISLDPNLAEAYLWKGISLRKENKHAEARQALQRAFQLDPGRVWTKQQLDKTPPQ